MNVRKNPKKNLRFAGLDISYNKRHTGAYVYPKNLLSLLYIRAGLDPC